MRQCLYGTGRLWYGGSRRFKFRKVAEHETFMSKRPWKCCPHTGISLTKLQRSNAPLTDEGYFDVTRLPDCDVYSVSSIAAICGFHDVPYFRDVVLANTDCPIHYHRVVLKDDAAPRRNGTIYATRTNSAIAGGKMWHSMQLAEARTRALACKSDISSRCNI
jgi:hypothetical protein